MNLADRGVDDRHRNSGDLYGNQVAKSHRRRMVADSERHFIDPVRNFRRLLPGVGRVCHRFYCRNLCAFFRNSIFDVSF